MPRENASLYPGGPNSNILAHDGLVGVLVGELVFAVSKHAGGELLLAVAPRHVGHAQARAELGVVSRGHPLSAAPATWRAVPIAAQTTRELQELTSDSAEVNYGTPLLKTSCEKSHP